MSAATPIELTPAQPPGATRPPAPPGAPPGAQSFHSALEGELARTAPAEGQAERSPEGASSQPAREHRQQSADGDAQAVAAQEAVVSSAATSSTAIAAAVATQPPDAREAPASSGASLPSSPVTADRLSTSQISAPAVTADPSLTSPAPGATPPLSTVGTDPKPSSPRDGQEPDEAAGTGISISHAQENQARPGVPVTAPPVRSSEVAPPGPGSEAGEARAPGIAVPEGPPKQAPGPVDPGIRVQGGAVKRSLEDLAAGLSPDAEAATESASHGAPTAPAARTGEPAPDTLSASPDHESRSLPAAAASTGPASAPPGTADGSTSPLALPAPSAPPTTAAAPTQPPVVAAGVGMQEMIESVRATIGLAVRQGISQARIALQPAELGEIRVHLSQGADGLVARVTAGSEAAAQALAQGRAELHHSLSTIGTSLLRLEIGAFNQPSRDRERSAGDASAPASARGATGAAGSIEEDEPAAPIPAAAAAGPRGDLVDVLA